tara:strand:+ start:10964 stop:11224 length:261 start_codon:yes stop_codon:yes gene_type:complete
MKKYRDYLDEKEREAAEPKKVFPYTENDEVNHLRQLVEDMTRWMSIGSYGQKTPQNMVREFKETMSKANTIVRQNKWQRENNGNIR